MNRPTFDEVREWFYYHPSSGDLVWKHRQGQDARINKRLAGHQVGTIDGQGYIHLWIDGRCFRAHSIIWLYVTGSWPNPGIDHKNRDRSDNSWSNLREATGSQNLSNRPKQRNNTSGFKGIYKKGTRWRAIIGVRGKSLFLGSFKTSEEAAAAYRQGALRYHAEFACYDQTENPIS